MSYLVNKNTKNSTAKTFQISHIWQTS